MKKTSSFVYLILMVTFGVIVLLYGYAVAGPIKDMIMHGEDIFAEFLKCKWHEQLTLSIHGLMFTGSFILFRYGEKGLIDNMHSKNRTPA